MKSMLIGIQIDDFIAAARIDKTKAGWKTTFSKPEVAAFDPAKRYCIHFETTEKEGGAEIALRTPHRPSSNG